MSNFTPLSALTGGVLIGLAASLVLFAHGRVAGISGIYAGLWQRAPSTLERWFRVAFIAGLVGTGVLIGLFFPSALPPPTVASIARASPTTLRPVIAGLLVGVGTRIGSGCTSGHGVCGLSRLSVRSLVATCTFMVTGVATVWLLQR